MCNGYTYGTTREAMLLVDNSGSMGLTGASGVVPFVLRAMNRVDPRCPRWGMAGYRSSPVGFPAHHFVTPLEPFRRGRSSLSTGASGLDFEEGWNENPAATLLRAADVWELPTDEFVEYDNSGTSEPLIDHWFGWGGRELHSGPPRRVIVMVGDEGTGFSEDSRDLIIPKLQEAEITVIAFSIWKAPHYCLNDGGIIAEICEATGGAIIEDLMNLLYDAHTAVLDAHGDPVLDENDEPVYVWGKRSDEEQDDVVERMAQTVRRAKWRDVGYPFVVHSAT
jgi:hypothetical protein